MLVFKYRKTGACKYLPHLDVLRHITRTLRRAGIEVDFSQGFNPHMLINLSPPIPLGVESESEYCFVSCKEKARDFKKLYNAVAVKDLECIECKNVAKNPNVAGISHSAEYLITMDGLPERYAEAEALLSSGEFHIEYFEKGAQTTKEVSGLILGISRAEEGLLARLRCGNVNLRADRFAYNLANKLDIMGGSVKIVKVKHFGLAGEKVTDIDKLLG